MTYTLSNLIADSFSHMGDLTVGVATGGSTTTIVDTKYRLSGETSAQWKGGFAIILRDAGGANAAPEEEYQRISGYSSNTITVDTAFSAAVASGDRYGLVSPLFNIELVTQLVNKALRNRIPKIPQMDTSLSTASNQTEYTLPALVGRELLRVEVQNNTGDSDDNRWTVLRAWNVNHGTMQSPATLTFGVQPPSGRTLRLTYLAPHPSLNDYSDVVDEQINPELARASLVLELENYKSSQRQHADPNARVAYDKAVTEFDEAMAKYNINSPKAPRIGRSKFAGA